jgi:diacylglycerol kinase family enzyme
MRTHSVLVINPRSGQGSRLATELVNAARKLGVETHLLAAGEEPGEAARAPGAEIIGMAGGDGSLAPVAQVTLGAFAGGTERRVDVGRVADRLFVNNVSFGVYAGLVHEREHHRRRGETLARARALLKVARHRHGLHACVNGEDGRARVILLGNNRYAVDLFTLGVRERLDEGVLQLWAAAGWLPTAWEEQVGARIRIEVPGGRVRAAIDGEPAEFESPLELETVPQALRVLVPAR